jgi:hypothetical protein
VLLTVLAAIAVVAYAAVAGAPVHHHVELALLFCGAFVVVQQLPIAIPRGDGHELVRFEEALVVPMALVLPAVDALLAIGVGVLVGSVIARAPAQKATFNVAQMVVSTAAVVGAVALLAGDAHATSPRAIGAAMVGLVAMFAINQLLMAGVLVRAGAGTGTMAVLRDGLGAKAAMWTANAALGAMLVPLAVDYPWLLALALLPLATMHASYRMYLSLRSAQQLAVGASSEEGLATETNAA